MDTISSEGSSGANLTFSRGGWQTAASDQGSAFDYFIEGQLGAPPSSPVVPVVLSQRTVSEPRVMWIQAQRFWTSQESGTTTSSAGSSTSPTVHLPRS